MQYTINVLEESRFKIPPEPIQTVQIDNIFKCPNCNCDVPITYYTDSRGEHPNTGLQCPDCNRIYSILL